MKYLLILLFIHIIRLSEAQLIPEFQIKNAKNGKVTRDSLLKYQKVTIINFWADWCAPCKEEMMEIKKIKSETEFKDVQFVSISIDRKEDLEKAKTWFAKNKLSWKLYFDPEKAFFNEILKFTDNSSSSIPVCLVVDKNGELVSFHQGFDRSKYKEELLEDINSIAH
jgi:peroxiredoxin